MDDAARGVDRELCEVAEAFDFLLQVTPINSEPVWEDFSRSNYQAPPLLEYRRPVDHSTLRRRLAAVPLHEVDDPLLSFLFREKRDELERQLRALRAIGAPEFLACSLELYGSVDNRLHELAVRLFTDAPRRKADSPELGFAEVDEVAAHAHAEVRHYHRRLPEFAARIEFSDDIASGMMVSGHRLLISTSIRVPRESLDALLHHEIGTHLVTYFNGRAQPLRQLQVGLAGYDELQEGLAILAEHLAGGLTGSRLRTLAARVLAVRAMIDGATFVDTFRLLHREYGGPPRASFRTTLRVFRGGGMSKDALYLRGLRDLLQHLDESPELAPLYVGKIGLEHLPALQALRAQGDVNRPVLLPRLWERSGVQERLEGLRGRSVLDLLEHDL